jgi:heptosyltransferase II
LTVVHSFLEALERALKRLIANVLRAVVSRRAHALPDIRAFKNVLVVRQHNQLGDMLCVVPLLRALRQTLPESRISLLASPVNAEIMMGNKYLDALVVFDKKDFVGRGLFHLTKLFSFLRRLRAERYDLVLCPATVSTSFTSDFLSFSTGSPLRVGASSLNGSENPSAFLYTHAVPLDWSGSPERHQTLRNLDLLSNWSVTTSDLSLVATLNDNEMAAANTFLSSKLTPDTRVVSIHCGAGKLPNRWPAERFAEVARRLCKEQSVLYVVVEGPMDKEPVGRLLRAMEGIDVLLVKGKPIRMVACILAHSHLLMTNDTGIMHVGAAVGVPVLSIFGPTDPRQWAPIGEKHRYIKGEEGDITTVATENVLRMAIDMLRESSRHAPEKAGSLL